MDDLGAAVAAIAILIGLTLIAVAAVIGFVLFVTRR